MTLTLVNCSERKNPPASSTAIITGTGVACVKAAQAACHEAHGDAGRNQLDAGHRQSEGKPADSEPDQEEAQEIERLADFSAQVLEKERHQRDAEKADRNVDEKDPVPTRIGGDEAA